jgi:hypothetical protein
VSQTIVALLCMAFGFLMIWMVLRIVGSGAADLGMAGAVMRKDQPATFWALTLGLMVVVILLLMLAAVLLVDGPIIGLKPST